MNALEQIATRAAADLRAARAEYQDCRRKGMPVMAEHYRRQVVKAWIALRQAERRMGKQ